MEGSPSLVRRLTTVVRAAIVALAIAIVPQGIWSALIGINLRTSPALPWAVFVMAALLIVFWLFLGGHFPPYGTSAKRKRYLRANRTTPEVFAWSTIAGLLGVGALSGAWILLAQVVRMPGNVLPTMAGVPSAVVVLAIFTGAIISPICEQAGIWGYGQTILRRDFGAAGAIVLSALIFAIAPHPPFGIALIPKIVFFFVTGVTFALSAELADSILPGLLVHALGLLTFFTMIWPNDPARPLLKNGGANVWFFAHVAQVIIFGTLSALAFVRLAALHRSPLRESVFQQ